MKLKRNISSLKYRVKMLIDSRMLKRKIFFYFRFAFHCDPCHHFTTMTAVLYTGTLNRKNNKNSQERQKMNKKREKRIKTADKGDTGGDGGDEIKRFERPKGETK